MTASEKHKPEIKWDQTAFEELKKTWPPERIAEDEKLLQDIFDLAAHVPLLAEALAWARSHGVKFFVDRTAEGIEGYHMPGTGVVGITAKSIVKPAEAIDTIVHELRHTWQDYNGFGVESAHGFAEYYTTVCLKEADAEAFGRRARDQYRFFTLKKNDEEIPDALRACLEKEYADLGANFQVWFPLFAESYGDCRSKAYNQIFKILPADNAEQPEARPDAGLSKEFDPKSVKFTGKKININNVQDVVRMGRFFSGSKNYLAALQPDILPRKILRPSLADIFWGAANDEQRKLTLELRRADLRKKCAPENRKPRRPLP